MFVVENVLEFFINTIDSNKMEGNHVRRVERLRKYDDSNVMTQHPPIWFPLTSLFFYEYN